MVDIPFRFRGMSVESFFRILSDVKRTLADFASFGPRRAPRAVEIAESLEDDLLRFRIDCYFRFIWSGKSLAF